MLNKYAKRLKYGETFNIVKDNRCIELYMKNGEYCVKKDTETYCTDIFELYLLILKNYIE